MARYKITLPTGAPAFDGEAKDSQAALEALASGIGYKDVAEMQAAARRIWHLDVATPLCAVAVVHDEEG